LVAGLAALVVFLVLLFNAPAPRGMSARERADAERALQATRARIEQLTQRAARGYTETFRIRVTEDEINLLLQTDNEVRRRMHQRGIEEAYVLLDSGRVVGAVRRRQMGAPITITAAATPRVKPDGTLDLDIEGIGIGRLSVPTVLARRLVDRAADALSGQRLGVGVDITAVKVETGSIVIDGRIGPRTQ
jgi:hypothetical protein